MNKTCQTVSREFSALVEAIPAIGFERHAASLIENARRNAGRAMRSIKTLKPLEGPKRESGIVMSAGPSLTKRNMVRRILEAGYPGTLLCVDGAYTACLKEGLIPDFVMTLDPHPTRTVRWFGDPDFEKSAENDDYFARQDLDIEFRKNSCEHNRKNIELVNRYAPWSRMIVSACSSPNVVERLAAARADMHWYNPLVDDPSEPESLTRAMHRMNRLPCINTGGTVGTAAWVFASTVLKIRHVAVVGMDFGYPEERSWKETQTYYELVDRLGGEEGVENYFVESVFPLTGERFYTDPTYYWYRQNFLELLSKAPYSETVNCTEGGTLIDGIACVSLDAFLAEHGGGDSPLFGGQAGGAS
jgi:hypothetical protein